MKNKKPWLLLGAGILTVLFAVVSGLYSVRYNESRLVVPMDFSEYVFRMKDLPMICSVILCCLYFGYLIVLIMRTAYRNKREVAKTQTTRRISPKFGFFGFFYEGKMSHTFMDERYRENAKRAQLSALKTAFGIMAAALLVLCCGSRLFGDPEITMIVAAVLLACGMGLEIFLTRYLLYRYDQKEAFCEGEDEDA